MQGRGTPDGGAMLTDDSIGAFASREPPVHATMSSSPWCWRGGQSHGSTVNGRVAWTVRRREHVASRVAHGMRH